MGSPPRPPRLLPADPGARRRRAAALSLALLAALLVGHVVARAEAVRGRWGDTTDVLVLTDPVPAGGEVNPVVEPRPWPRSLVPDDILPVADLAEGARASVPLAAGTPLTASVLSTDPDERREHVAVRTAPGSLPLRAGDRVSLWATFDPNLSPDGPTTRRVARGATVVSSDEERSVIAVHPDDTARVVEALAWSTVTLVSEPR